MSEIEIFNSNELNPENNNLSQKFIEEIVNPSLDLAIDYSEIFIDDLINNEIINKIPIVKSIVGIVKGGFAINQLWNAKKVLTFIKEFNNKKIEDEKREKFKQNLLHNPKKTQKIAEQLLIYIDRNIIISQTKIIANLFNAYVNEKITFDEFNNIVLTD